MERWRRKFREINYVINNLTLICIVYTLMNTQTVTQAHAHMVKRKRYEIIVPWFLLLVKKCDCPFVKGRIHLHTSRY